MEETSTSPSQRLFPEFSELVKPAFLSIAGSIPAFITALAFYLGSGSDYGAIFAMLFISIGSVVLAFSFVSLVAQIHRGLWAFFIIVYSILYGILTLFIFGTSPAFAVLVVSGPTAGILGGVLGAKARGKDVSDLASQQLTVGLVLAGGIVTLLLFVPLLFFGAYSVATFLIPGMLLALFGVILSKPSWPELFSLVGSFVPGTAIILAVLTGPFDILGSLFLLVEFGTPGQVLFAFALAQCLDADHRRFWGFLLAIGSVLVGIVFFVQYAYPLLFIYSTYYAPYRTALQASVIAFFIGPAICFWGGLMGVMRRGRPRDSPKTVPRSDSSLAPRFDQDSAKEPP